MRTRLFTTPRFVTSMGAMAAVLAVLTRTAEGITLTPITTGFNNPIGIDHHAPTNQVVMSVNYPSGLPHNFELVTADGTRTPFSNISGFTDEIKIATPRDDGGGISLGGFTPGELFTGSGVPGHVVRISPDGSTVQNPWVTLPGETGLLRGGLHVDRTGVFGGDLIVVTTAGGVWRIDSSGNPTSLASLGIFLEGVTTVPNDPAQYGPWAGKILAGVGGGGFGPIATIDVQGNTSSFDLGIGAEDLDIIPANENFFGVDFGGATLWGAPPSEFASMVGDVLIAQESPGALWDVRWDAGSNTFQVTQIAQVAQWEHVTFSTAGIVEIPPTGACCDRSDFTCQDGVVEADCQGPDQEWTEGTLCDDVDPPCELPITDCNGNGTDDAQDIASGESLDCNGNGIPDECDIAGGDSQDANGDGVPDECRVVLDLDIKPGSCPNPVNLKSRGVVPMAIVGSESFDVTEIDIDSLVLSRADGVGGFVVPLMGPPGPGIRVEDVATPFEGDLCDCQELEGDGFADMALKFSTPELMEMLELNSPQRQMVVTLTLRGTLLDGTEFEASDCMILVSEAAAPRSRRSIRKSR